MTFQASVLAVLPFPPWVRVGLAEEEEEEEVEESLWVAAAAILLLHTGLSGAKDSASEISKNIFICV